MKYKLIPENKEVKKTRAAKKFPLPFGNTVSAITNASPIPAKSAKNVAFGLCSLAMIIPSLFAKVFFFIKRVLFANTTINGTKAIVDHIITLEVASKPRPDLANAAEAIPKLIPNQNTKFQNLSLVSHLDLVLGRLFVATSGFVKSCIKHSHVWFKPYTVIIPKIEVIAKRFMAISSIIGLCLLHNSAYGVVNSNEVVFRHKIIELIKMQETKHHIPPGLLLAVIKTESNLNPFALNINGKSLFFNDKDKAIKAINEAIASGATNLDIGLAQINYRWHGENFTSVDSMLSPELNINYAAELLSKLKLTHGDWHKALRYYHSARPIHHKAYSRKVVMCWLGM